MVEAVFPMHRHFRVAVLIGKKEAGISVHHPLAFRLFPVLDDCPEALCHILRHGQLPCPSIGFRGFYDQPHIESSLKLVADIDDLVFQVNIPKRQSAKFCFCQLKSKKIIFYFSTEKTPQNQLHDVLPILFPTLLYSSATTSFSLAASGKNQSSIFQTISTRSSL